MHRMQSGGWPYSKVGRDSSKAPSLRAAVYRAAVFRLKILRSNCNHWSSRHQCVNEWMLTHAYRGAAGIRSIKAQGKQCMLKGCVCINVPIWLSYHMAIQHSPVSCSLSAIKLNKYTRCYESHPLCRTCFGQYKLNKYTLDKTTKRVGEFICLYLHV